MKQELEQFIDREARNVFNGINPNCRESFKEGANLLLPLLLDAIDCLEFYSSNNLKNARIGMPINDILVKEFYINGINARETLTKIREKIKGEL